MRTRPLLPLFVVASLAALCVSRLSAQPVAPAAPDQPVPAAPVPAVPAPAAAAALADKPATADEVKPAGNGAPAAAKAAVGKDTLSVDFPDTDIREILRNVADLFELNIVMPDSLQGKTTIKFREVTWRQIFTNILEPVNYAFVEDGNIIKIISKDLLNDEPTTTEVFLINYARAADIAPTIASLVDPAKGKLVVDARSNSLVITERPTRMTKIKPIIERLDLATDQVMIETKFVEVTNNDLKNIGVNWASLGGYQVKAGNLGGTLVRDRGQTGSNGFNATNGNAINNVTGTNSANTTSVTGTQNSGSNNTGTVSATNGTPTATSTTATTGSLSNTTTNTNTNGTTGTTSDTTTNALNFLNALTNTDSTARTLSAVFSATDFSLVLSALQTLNESKVVSNPTIVTLNNSEATINVGEERPIPRYMFNPQTGTTEVNGFDFKAVGVILKVTPQVNGRGDIKLTVEPEVSQSNNSVAFKGDQIPVISTRKAKTTVSLADGYTMGIGGLMQSQSINGNTKVPLFGSIPVLGRLFRSDNKSTESKNLIIFITAKTLSAHGAPVEQVFDSARVRELQIRREDLSGYRDGSNPYASDKPPATKTSSSRLTSPEAAK